MMVHVHGVLDDDVHVCITISVYSACIHKLNLEYVLEGLSLETSKRVENLRYKLEIKSNPSLNGQKKARKQLPLPSSCS